MQPTASPDVDAILMHLAGRMRETLGNQLRGLYLFGSLVTGDFDVRLSDVDLAAIVASRITTEELTRLATMHAEIAGAFPAWKDRIEVGYLAVDDVQPFDPAANIAIISPGEPFHARVAEHSWLFNLHVVRERGETLLGPDPKTLIAPISANELKAGLRARMREWRDWTGEEVPPMHAGEQAYVVLTMCRALYTYVTGDWTSKRQAARWAMTAAPKWSELIRQAVAWREAEPAEPVDLAASQAQMLAFAREVTGRIIAAAHPGQPTA